jgi:subtilisin family serine protease
VSTPRPTPARLLAILALLLTLLPASPTLAAPAAQGTITARPEPAAAAKPDPDDLSVSRYIVQLRGEPIALHVARQRGAPAARLDLAAPDAVGQQNAIRAERAAALQAIDAALGDAVTPVATYEVVLNGMAVDLTGAQAARLVGLPQVAAVTKEEIHEPTTDVGPEWIGADGIWDGSATGVYATTILGANMTPPVATAASGRGIFRYDPDTGSVSYQVGAGGFSGPLTAATMRRATDDSAVATLSGGAVIGFNGGLLLSPTDAALFEGGQLYVRFDTAANPNGEARGDIAGYRGEGVVVGIIDSGINTTHPSFAAAGGDGYRHLNPLGAGNYKGACDPANLPSQANGNPSGYNPAIQCNDKLIGAWTFAATAPVGSPAGEPSPNDSDGHGSHTASTAAGNVVLDSNVGGMPYGRIAGVAPHANIIAYDVCGFINNGAYSANCPSAALVAAVEQAVRDQVDVINYSISGGASPWTDPVEQAFLAARAAGVVVSASAGNSGPDAGTVAHVSPWLLSVAAATHNRRLQNQLTDFAGGAALPTITGAGFSAALTANTAVVYAGSPAIGNALCGPFTAGQAALVAGKVVVCDRGTYGRVEKAQNVQAAGGAGYVLANAANGNSLSADVFPIPGVHITYNDGVALKAWVAAASSPTARISGTSKDLSASNGDVMASFSSRGPALGAGTFTLKPDIAAPGVDVFAAYENDGVGAPDYGILSGTSMAAPHVAGAAALVAGLNPSWTPGQIQSALMTTALDALRKEDGVTPATPFDSGAGRVRVDLAAMAGLVLDETRANFNAANPASGGDPRTLNTPSMADPGCIVTCTWTRTVRNTFNAPATWTATTSDAGLTVSPSSFTLGPGASQTLTITLSAAGKRSGSTFFGRVTLSADGDIAPDAALPVAATLEGTDMPDTLYAAGGSGAFEATLPARTVPFSGLSVQYNGMTRGTATPLSFDEGELFSAAITLPPDTARLVAEITQTTSQDADLYIYEDDGDGIPNSADILRCTSATPEALEYCNLTAPAAGVYFVEAMNYTASTPGATDTATLVTAVVPAASAGNFTISGPASSPGGAANLRFAFNLAGSQPGDRWYGRFSLTNTGDSSVIDGANVDFVQTTASALSVRGGNTQSARAGTAFAQELSVVVTDAAGYPVVGVPVTFAAPATGASATLSATAATTDLYGEASVTATANGALGAYQVTALIGGASGPLSASFDLTNTTGVAASINATGGGAQSARVGTPFANPLVVVVRDGFGNPVPGAKVQLTAPGSGASANIELAGASMEVTTDGTGTAQAALRANTVAGIYAVIATIAGPAGPVTASFSLTNAAGPAASITASGGTTQSARVGTAFAAPLAVAVADNFGNPVSGATVTFAAPASGASATLSAATATTGPDGKASVTATANGAAGAYTVTASVGGSGSVTASFSLANTSGPASRVFVYLPLTRR